MINIHKISKKLDFLISIYKQGELILPFFCHEKRKRNQKYQDRPQGS